MAKFKLRLFQSCRSKDHSTLPIHPITTTKQLPRSSFKSHVSSAFGCGSKSGDHSDTDYFHWQEDDRWHVVAKIYDVVESPRRKIYNSSVSGGDTDNDVLPLKPTYDKKKRRRCRKLKLNKTEIETDIDPETNKLISSFSTDSSTDYNPQLETIRESVSSHRYKVKKKRTSLCKRNVSAEWGSPARLSVFKKLIPCKVVEGKMKESFAVVKRSEDPYEDFKRSMMEMIIEKQMFERNDLEQLLQCFLSLNSRFHHGLIVEAFSEIWETMFADLSLNE